MLLKNPRSEEQNFTIFENVKNMCLPDFSFEKRLRSQGFLNIAGIDEVGRGSWAGPLVAAGVVLPDNFAPPQGFSESKSTSPPKRVEFAYLIEKAAITISIAEVRAGVIDKIGISKATNKAFRLVAKRLNPEPDFFLLDAFCIKHFPKKKQLAIVKGDKRSVSIAAASIIAKVHRDNLMVKLSKAHPQYGFARNKGYGTRVHQEAIRKYGFTQIHRMSYNLNYLNS